MTETLSSDLPEGVEARVQKILQTCCERDISIATAESCTGGLIASLLTDVSGCSRAFERGVVTYTDDAKREMLGVDHTLIAQHGVVSEAVARAMAEGALLHSTAQVSVSVTGYAGPTDEGEEGLVHFACAVRGGPVRHREEHFGAQGRGGVRLACLDAATAMLEEALA